MTSKFLFSYAALAIATLVFGMGNSGSINLLSANSSGTLDRTFKSTVQLLASSCSLPLEEPPKKANSEDSV